MKMILTFDATTRKQLLRLVSTSVLEDKQLTELAKDFDINNVQHEFTVTEKFVPAVILDVFVKENA